MNFIIVVILILIILINVCTFKYSERVLSAKLLKGLWIGDLGFLENAQLSNMIFYINDELDKVYLIISDEKKEVIINELIDVKISNKYLSSDIIYNITFNTELDNFPSKQKLIYSPDLGTLTLESNHTVYGVLHKDTQSIL